MGQLNESGKALFFPVANTDQLNLDSPALRLGNAFRTHVRSLSVMQKEALVVAGRTGAVWRLASDEGAYLNGDEVARRNAPATPEWDSSADGSHPDDDAVVFEGLEFALHSGEMLLLEGRNGCGKTSLMRAIAGMLSLETGEVFWNDVPVLKQRTHLPVVVDPSHGTGHTQLVPAMARAGIAAGAVQ